jgi:hypothetical protein
MYRRICLFTRVYRCLYAFTVWTAVICVHRRLSCAFTCVPRGPVLMLFYSVAAIMCIPPSVCVYTCVPPSLCVYNIGLQ